MHPKVSRESLGHRCDFSCLDSPFLKNHRNMLMVSEKQYDL